MRIIGKNSASWLTILLSAVLLISISGLQMQYHHCYVSGNVDYLITFPGTSDSSNTGLFNCDCDPQETAEPLCENCHANKPIPLSKSDCCETGTELMLLGLEYVVNSTQKIETPKIVDLYSPASILHNDFEDHLAERSYYTNDSPPKPRFYGKFVLILNNQLKIPSA